MLLISKLCSASRGPPIGILGFSNRWGTSNSHPPRAILIVLRGLRDFRSRIFAQIACAASTAFNNIFPFAEIPLGNSKSSSSTCASLGTALFDKEIRTTSADTTTGTWILLLNNMSCTSVTSWACSPLSARKLRNNSTSAFSMLHTRL